MRFTTENVLRRVTIILLIGIAAFILMGVAANAEEIVKVEQVCNEGNSGKIDVSGGTTLTITAPEGYLIYEYCVKAGSVKQGNGPEYFTVEPPAASVTISHSSGKDISHYSAWYVQIPPEETTTTTVPETTTTTVPEEETTTTTEPPVTTTTEPPVTTTTEVPPVVPETPVVPDEPVLPETGMELIPWAIAGALLASLGTLAVRYSK